MHYIPWIISIFVCFKHTVKNIIITRIPKWLQKKLTFKYYCEYGNNRSIQVNILNEFKDIKKSHEINVKDLSDNHYDIYKSDMKKYCTILLIDDINTSRILISEENMYYIWYDDDDCDETVYYKILGDIDRIESDRNNIVNLIDSDNRKHGIALLVDNSKIFICESLWCWCGKNCSIY